LKEVSIADENVSSSQVCLLPLVFIVKTTGRGQSVACSFMALQETIAYRMKEPQ